MDRTYIQLNATNTLTITLMVMIGYFLIAVLTHVVFYAAGKPMGGMNAQS